MNAKQLEVLLNDLGACSSGKEWAKCKTLKKVWTTLDRADWMLWLLGKMSDKPGWSTRNEVIGLAVDCAETALPIWEKKYPNDNRIKACLEGTRKFLKGEITRDELLILSRATYDAAYAAADAAYAAAADAADAATYAADAATYAATYAADAAYAAAADAAYAATYAAYDAADARKQAHIKMCEIIRAKIPVVGGK